MVWVLDALRFDPFRTIVRGHQAIFVPKAAIPMTLEPCRAGAPLLHDPEP